MICKRTAALLVIFIGFASELRSFQTPTAENRPSVLTRRVLILNEENATYPGINIINQGIQVGLNGSPYQLQLYSEYMDTTLFPDQAIQQELRDAYIRKYQNLKLDVIITVGPSPLRFMEGIHRRAFPGVPIVFCLPAIGAPAAALSDPDFAGVENDIAPAKTVGIALRLVPGTRNVVVVGGVAPIDREVLANVKKELQAYEGRVEISYLTDLAMPDLLERLRRLPSNTVILLTSIGQDGARTSFKANESSPLIIGAANAPVFSLFDVHLNHGEVGGDLSNLSAQGRLAGDMALRMLKGEKAREIPRVKGVNTYMFDWRALKRWGLKESALPPGSLVINRQPTIWDSYKWYIIAGISLILLEALLISALLLLRIRARKAESELTNLTGRLIAAQEEERRRLARELHDDYSQRLALVANSLDMLHNDDRDGSLPVEIGQGIHDVRNQIEELSVDLHSLSHSLHSSTLETLGLVAGVKAFCKEFAQQQGMQIDFGHHDVPPGIPPDLALGLFRITQEALRNVKRHSGADHAEVRLEWSLGRLHLAISDRGRGFDPPRHPAEAGIGLQSIEERVRLAGGQIEIHSRPSEGMRIDVYVPFQIGGQGAS